MLHQKGKAATRLTLHTALDSKGSDTYAVSQPQYIIHSTNMSVPWSARRIYAMLFIRITARLNQVVQPPAAPTGSMSTKILAQVFCPKPDARNSAIERTLSRVQSDLQKRIAHALCITSAGHTKSRIKCLHTVSVTQRRAQMLCACKYGFRPCLDCALDRESGNLCHCCHVL